VDFREVLVDVLHDPPACERDTDRRRDQVREDGAVGKVKPVVEERDHAATGILCGVTVLTAKEENR